MGSDLHVGTGTSLHPLPIIRPSSLPLNKQYLTVLVHTRAIKSMRDLSPTHLPLLRDIRSESHRVTHDKFGVDHNKLRLFVHYQPSYCVLSRPPSWSRWLTEAIRSLPCARRAHRTRGSGRHDCRPGSSPRRYHFTCESASLLSVKHSITDEAAARTLLTVPGSISAREDDSHLRHRRRTRPLPGLTGRAVDRAVRHQGVRPFGSLIPTIPVA